MLTAQGPRLIDWLGAARSPAAYEIAQCHVLLAEIGPAALPGRLSFVTLSTPERMALFRVGI